MTIDRKRVLVIILNEAGFVKVAAMYRTNTRIKYSAAVNYVDQRKEFRLRLLKSGASPEPWR
jgi:hypothetical protein